MLSATCRNVNVIQLDDLPYKKIVSLFAVISTYWNHMWNVWQPDSGWREDSICEREPDMCGLQHVNVDNFSGYCLILSRFYSYRSDATSKLRDMISAVTMTALTRPTSLHGAASITWDVYCYYSHVLLSMECNLCARARPLHVDSACLRINDKC